MPTIKNLLSFAAGVCILATTHSALGGAHTWRVNELCSSPDGQIQFIELKECCGNPAEHGVTGSPLTSSLHSITISFTTSPQSTANRTILIATPAFAALPGAPTPDVIISAANVPFFNPAGDTVSYSAYDSMTFGAGEMPTDCAFSINDSGGSNVIAPNSPKKFNGTTRWVDGCTPCDGDFLPAGGSGAVDVVDLLGVINAWGSCPAGVPCIADCAPAGGDGNVTVLDLLAVINNWGTCD